MSIHNEYIKNMCSTGKFHQYGIYAHIRNNILFEPYDESCCWNEDKHKQMNDELLAPFFSNKKVHPDFWLFNPQTSDYEWHEVVWQNDISKQKMIALYWQKDFLEDRISKITNQHIGLNLYVHNLKTNQFMEIDIYGSGCFQGDDYRQVVVSNKNIRLVN